MDTNHSSTTTESGSGKGEDLATILNASQRADLTLLIANITESMRKLILLNFDPSAGLDKTLLRENMTEDEKLMSADPASADVEAYDKERKLKEQNEKDLGTLKMRNLKRNSLKAFDNWREQVILRVGHVVNSEDAAKDQLKTSESERSRPTAPTTVGKITDVPRRNTNLKFKDLFPPVKTALTKLPMNKRTLVLHSILLLLLSLEYYNAPSRILLLNLCSSLKLPLRTFEQDEYVTAKGLLESAKELTASEETKKKAEENKENRKWKVGLATVAGAAILGYTGGLAAPLVSAGVGSVATGLGLGTTAAAGYLGSVAGSTVLVGGLFGAYGGRMTGQMMDNYAREVEDFEFIPVHSNKKTSEEPEKGAKQASEHDHKLRVTICVSGWLTEKEEVTKPWRVLGQGAEVFGLKFELEALLNLGNAMNGMVQSAAWGYAQKEIIGQTIFAELASAMWPLGLMKVARVIDNPFSVGKGRADKAGEVLADALINKAQGERPVTLIGYSLGARVIYTCLKSLAKRKAFGLVEHAVLIGAPTPSDTQDWRTIRTAVAGRLVNVYSTNDYILGFMYRTSAIQYGVAGLQKIEGLPSIENVDVSEEVDGHLRYRFLVGAILKKIGFEDINMQAVKQEQEALEKMVMEEKENSLQAQRDRLLKRESTGGKVDEGAEAEHEASEIEKKVQEQTKLSLVSKVIQWWYAPSAPNVKDFEKIAGNVQKAIQNPSDARAVLNDTAKDVQSGGQTMAQRAYQALPNIPYMSRSAQDVAKSTQAPKQDGSSVQELSSSNAIEPVQSYTAKAAEYLPVMPSLPGFNKTKSPGSQPAEVIKDKVETGTDATKKVARATTDVATTTVKNVTNFQDNPTVEQAKSIPGVKQAAEKDPGVGKGLGEASNALATTVENVTDNTTGIGSTVADKVGSAGKTGASATDTVRSTSTAGIGDAGKTKVSEAANTSSKTVQSYTSRAASYLPSIPSMRGFGRSATTEKAKKSPPKLEKRVSSGAKSSPKLGNRKESNASSSLSRTASGIKSPLTLQRGLSGTRISPKLDRLPSGVKSPPSLQRLPSGMKSPPALQRLPSGVKSPANETSRTVTKSPSEAVDRGAEATKQPVATGQRIAKTGADAAMNTAAGAFGGMKKLGGIGN